MAGAYCQFCGNRCFVYREVYHNGKLLWAGHMATCTRGKAWDKDKLGFDVDDEAAHNPYVTEVVS